MISVLVIRFHLLLLGLVTRFMHGLGGTIQGTDTNVDQKSFPMVCGYQLESERSKERLFRFSSANSVNSFTAIALNVFTLFYTCQELRENQDNFAVSNLEVGGLFDTFSIIAGQYIVSTEKRAYDATIS